MEEIKFPKTFELYHLNELSDSESKLKKYCDKFVDGEKIILKSEANVIKKIKICTESKLLKYVNMLINDKVIERVKPEFVDGQTIFEFKTFDRSGIVQVPKLFDICFSCEPKVDVLDIEISFHEIVFDGWLLDFMKYNQYYSIHQIEEKKKMLTIYYAPIGDKPYNVKFLDLKDFDEFYKAINIGYDWKCPTLYKPNTGKKELFRIITVEIKPGMLNEDKELQKYESHEVKLSENIVSKSFVVPKDERKDIMGYLLADYGLIAYSTVMSSFKHEIDYDQMEKIKKSITEGLNLLIGE